MRAILLCVMTTVVFFLPGCFVVGESGTLDETWTFEQPITQVIVDLDAAPVAVAGVDCEGAQVVLDADILGPAPEYEVAVEGETLIVRRLPDPHWTTFVRGGFSIQVSQEVELELVADSGAIVAEDVVGPVTAQADSGAITVRDVALDVTVEADSGALELRDIGGNVWAEADSGAIRGEGIQGSCVHAETDSGAIVLDIEGEPESVDARADSGAIEITVPSGTYDIHTRSDSGWVDIDGLCHDGAAAATLWAETDSGAIFLRGR